MFKKLYEQSEDRHFSVQEEHVEYVCCYLRAFFLQVSYEYRQYLALKKQKNHGVDLKSRHFQEMGVHLRVSCAEYSLEESLHFYNFLHPWVVDTSPEKPHAHMDQKEEGINFIVLKLPTLRWLLGVLEKPRCHKVHALAVFHFGVEVSIRYQHIEQGIVALHWISLKCRIPWVSSEEISLNSMNQIFLLFI